MSNTLVYELTGVSKEFQGSADKVSVLRQINLTVEQGESLAILGSSGSGKTTLLHILGTLDSVSGGQAMFYGRDMSKLSPLESAQLRNKDIGFVYQFHNLLPEFTTRENVAMPAIIAGFGPAKARAMADEALEMAGIAHRAEYGVTTLSGGERQRAAVARAIIMKPKVLLADEPTGSLDEETGEHVGELLATLNRELGTTLVVVTHNRWLAGLMQRQLELRSGELYVQ